MHEDRRKMQNDFDEITGQNVDLQRLNAALKTDLDRYEKWAS